MTSVSGEVKPSDVLKDSAHVDQCKRAVNKSVVNLLST